MNPTEKEALKRDRQDCALGIKAFQNLTGASSAFERLIEVFSSKESLILSSLFHYGVIKYAKPFVETKYNGLKIKYKVSKIKTVTNFSKNIHDHLIELRNTLIAHDDFDQIGSRLLFMTFVPDKTNFSIPIGLKLANKCLLYPSSKEEVQEIFQHVKIALSAVQEKLMNDIDEYRKKLIGISPEVMSEIIDYQKEFGRFDLNNGVLIPPANTFDDRWVCS